MKIRHWNQRLAAVFLTALLALVYAAAARADMATAVVEEKKSQAKGIECSIKVQHPTDAADPLTRAVNAYINEKLGGVHRADGDKKPGGSYRGDILDVRAMVSHYIAECLERNKDAYRADWTDDEPAAESRLEIVRLAESDTFVSYEFTDYFRAAMGHGGTGCDNVTFRKSDGRRMGWDAFVHTHGPGFKNLLKQGLKKLLEAETDAELDQSLILEGGVKALSRPRIPPLFTREGVRFKYSEHEITPTAWMPEFVVPYAEIAPYLTPEARAMVGLDAASAGAASSSWSAAAEEEEEEVEEVEETDEQPDQPVAAAPGRLTDARHRQFLRESAEYRAADERLNAAWKRVKERLSAKRYRQALAEQRAWLRRGRDAEAARLSGLSPVEAFTRVTEERARELEDL